MCHRHTSGSPCGVSRRRRPPATARISEHRYSSRRGGRARHADVSLRGMRPWMAYAGFAVFGAFWGTWGASLPAIRDQAGVTDGQLGTALLFVGAGALPAMLVAGRAVDRWRHRATAAFLTAFGGVGVVVAAAAHDMPSLCVALA